MTYQNRSRKLLSDFTWIGLLGGGVTALISAAVLNRGGSESEIAGAALFLSIGQVLFGFGVLTLVGFMVATSVANDIRNANLPESTEQVPEPGEHAVVRPDAEPIL